MKSLSARTLVTYPSLLDLVRLRVRNAAAAGAFVAGAAGCAGSSAGDATPLRTAGMADIGQYPLDEGIADAASDPLLADLPGPDGPADSPTADLTGGDR